MRAAPMLPCRRIGRKLGSSAYRGPDIGFVVALAGMREAGGRDPSLTKFLYKCGEANEPRTAPPLHSAGGTPVRAFNWNLVRRGHQVTLFVSGDSMARTEIRSTHPPSA